jgi:hypothetical protein
VFIDVVTIQPGADFVAMIERAIGDCDVVLALIGDDWLTAADDRGGRRIDQPQDWVHLELSSALARDDVRVIPVLVEGAEMPSASVLPGALAQLARRNAVELTDARWRSETAVLIDAIDASSEGGSDRAADGHASHGMGLGWIVAALAGWAGVWFIVTSRRTHDRMLLIAGVVYTVPVLVGVADVLDDGSSGGTIFGLWFLAGVTSLIHFIVIRARVGTPRQPSARD